MSLKLQSAADARAIINTTTEWGWPITLTSPAGVALALNALTTDVRSSIDPETGVMVTGRRASATVSLLDLPTLPVAVHDAGARPWLVTMADVTGAAATWKVIEVLPDRALGLVVLLLGGYGATPD